MTFFLFTRVLDNDGHITRDRSMTKQDAVMKISRPQ